MSKLAIISLKYLEPYYADTLKCLEGLPYNVFYADRDGVGNMSRAFNEAVHKLPDGYDYIWLITNITFTPEVPQKLMDVLDLNKDYSAVHPAMSTSDHPHLWPGEVREVPFIELTAPMFRLSDFKRFYLCEQTPYYYMDLIISYQLKQACKKLLCCGDTDIHHTYLRNQSKFHPITHLRKQLRDYHTEPSKKYMTDTYGPDWKKTLWPQ